MLYEQILSEHQRLIQQIQSTKEQLDNLPVGKLICCRHGKYSKWYQSHGHCKFYIPKSNRTLAEQLAQKKYLSMLLKDLEKEKKAVEAYLKLHSPTIDSEQLLTASSEFQKLLSPFFSPRSKELADWMNHPYEKNSAHPETLIYKTISGDMVRSKSELLIDMCLRTHKIPFRYECALNLGDITIYPDFTIQVPSSRKIYYWEHFGMMDNDSYITNACSKLRLYASYGITPGIHLITTYETKEQPLSTETIEKCIEQYLL